MASLLAPAIQYTLAILLTPKPVLKTLPNGSVTAPAVEIHFENSGVGSFRFPSYDDVAEMWVLCVFVLCCLGNSIQELKVCPNYVSGQTANCLEMKCLEPNWLKAASQQIHIRRPLWVTRRVRCFVVRAQECIYKKRYLWPGTNLTLLICFYLVGLTEFMVALWLNFLCAPPTHVP